MFNDIYKLNYFVTQLQCPYLHLYNLT